jgi:hypothetical protein
MNYLVTLNIGNVLTDNARESMLVAARRWGCGFYEITQNRVGSGHVCFNKYWGISDLRNDPQVGRVFYLDADVLIRNDAPNPFDTFPDFDGVYAVLDAQYLRPKDDVDAWRNEIVAPFLRQVHAACFWPMVNLAHDIATAQDWFVGAGAFILHPDSPIDVIGQMVFDTPDETVHGWYEQALWNYILRHGAKVVLMNPTWDRVQPDVSTGKMQDYVYHFTGPRDHAKLKALVATYDWHV